MRTTLMIICFTCLSFLAKAQYDSGRLLTIGFGAGDSRHAGSYTVEEDFRTKEFSGFRALVIELKAGWNFWEMTSVYGVGRFSPPNSIISPYRSTYFGLGLSQAIPVINRIYFIGNYGYYKSSLGKGRATGNGNLLNLGVGIKLDDNIYMEFNNTTGKLSNIDPSVDISSDANQWFGIVSFRF